MRTGFVLGHWLFIFSRWRTTWFCFKEILASKSFDASGNFYQNKMLEISVKSILTLMWLFIFFQNNFLQSILYYCLLIHGWVLFFLRMLNGLRFPWMETILIFLKPSFYLISFSWGQEEDWLCAWPLRARSSIFSHQWRTAWFCLKENIIKLPNLYPIVSLIDIKIDIYWILGLLLETIKASISECSSLRAIN